MSANKQTSPSQGNTLADLANDRQDNDSRPGPNSSKAKDPVECTLLARWRAEQDQIKSKVITENVEGLRLENLRWVGGVDISFVEGSAAACGVLVVLDRMEGYKVKHVEKVLVPQLDHPYIPGFLAFRELPVLRRLFSQLESSRRSDPNVPVPTVVMVDGNGLLHPNKVGLACHLGVALDIPVIGVAKNLHAVDGLSKGGLETVQHRVISPGIYCKMLIGETMGLLGAAVYKEGRANPVFVSVGHKLDLNTAVCVTGDSMIYRVPEPTRQADILSRTECRQYREALLAVKP